MICYGNPLVSPPPSSLTLTLPARGWAVKNVPNTAVRADGPSVGVGGLQITHRRLLCSPSKESIPRCCQSHWASFRVSESGIFQGRTSIFHSCYCWKTPGARFAFSQPGWQWCLLRLMFKAIRINGRCQGVLAEHGWDNFIQETAEYVTSQNHSSSGFKMFVIKDKIGWKNAAWAYRSAFLEIAGGLSFYDTSDMYKLFFAADLSCWAAQVSTLLQTITNTSHSYSSKVLPHSLCRHRLYSSIPVPSRPFISSIPSPRANSWQKPRIRLFKWLQTQSSYLPISG